MIVAELMLGRATMPARMEKDGQHATRPGPPGDFGEPPKVSALEQPRHHHDRQQRAAHDKGDERAQRG
jgi:hypothetical protein